MGNCNCKRSMCPDGLWTKSDLIGAHVHIMSMPASNFSVFQDADKVCIISDILFRTTLDGKTTTVIKLEEFPDMFFTWKDLRVSELEYNNNNEQD